MGYTCIRCLADTDNDCDICEECLQEAKDNHALMKAADEIERLRAENERLREALRYYADNHYPRVNDGPWGANSNDFGDVARAALAEQEKK